MNCGIASPMTCSKTQLERAVVKLSHLSQVQIPDLRDAPDALRSRHCFWTLFVTCIVFPIRIHRD